MIFSQDRTQLRRLYHEVLVKDREGRALEPLEAIIASVIREHPEYHRFLEEDDALDRDFLPEAGETNPFLHMSLHIAIREQTGIDRPPGIRAAFRALAERRGDPHEAEHLMLECLAEELWRAQRDGCAPDESAYLAAVQALV